MPIARFTLASCYARADCSELNQLMLARTKLLATVKAVRSPGESVV